MTELPGDGLGTAADLFLPALARDHTFARSPETIRGTIPTEVRPGSNVPPVSPPRDPLTAPFGVRPMPVLPIAHFTWQVLRTAKRSKKPPTGRTLRTVPNRRTKDGTFLTELVDLGLLDRVTGTADRHSRRRKRAHRAGGASG